MAKIIKKEHYRDMYEAILQLQSIEECENFFRDLCSPTERSAMEQRYEVASLLMQDKVYVEILEKTSASTATISRVKRMLTDGTGVMPQILEKMQEIKKQG